MKVASTTGSEKASRVPPQQDKGRMSRTREWLAAAVVCFAVLPAGAAVTPRDYRDVGVTLPANAGVPADAAVTDERGRVRPFGGLISQPSVLVFADYTCTT